MKKILFFFALLILITTGCRKVNDLPENVSKPIHEYLKQNLLSTDYSELDFSNIQATSKFVRVGFKNKNILKDGVILLVASDGTVAEGKILHIEGSIVKEGNGNGKVDFVGLFKTFSMNRSKSVTSAIKNGYLMDLHTYSTTTVLSTNAVLSRCTDCTLEDVVVTASYRNTTEPNWGAWLSLVSFFDSWPSILDYIPIDSGGGGSSPPSMTIDPQPNAENEKEIDPKKYTDCFGSVPDNATTMYTVTISADVPVNDQPGLLLNSDLFPGHVFITLSKATPFGGISQNIGFYPFNSIKAMVGSVESKSVDDGGHEYQANYTISISSSQFKAAIDQISTASRNKYNLGSYNCTDFALDVFNAAGGNFSIPKYEIFPTNNNNITPTLSNTPQGLFQKINELKSAGTPNTQATKSVYNAGNSKGTCN